MLVETVYDAAYGVFRESFLGDRFHVCVLHASQHDAERRCVSPQAQISDPLLERHDTEGDTHGQACHDAEQCQ